MANLESLTARSLCYYELGRLRMAARVVLVVLPLVAVCLLDREGRKAGICCGVPLLLGSVLLRFRNRAGVESVTTGLLAGTLPLAAVLLLMRVDPGCAKAGVFSFCAGFSLLLGAGAGAVVALRERARSSSADSWLFTAGIALLTAGLGCARLGLASLVGVALGMLFGRYRVRRSLP
ncbi:MAG TPA: hypothetical protein VER96_29435 [Polyangiaceae bacterium]|nr:hypothetical protein [Polyangiaceae bacterium]